MEYRITPAGAGKTRYGSRVSCKPWDHPRRCGENSASSTSFAQIRGSPPQVRGKHPRGRSVGDCTGITPAGAGKTKV